MSHEDLRFAKLYQCKNKNALAKGHEFSLSFAEFKALRRATHCYYLGVPLTEPVHGEADRPTDWTLDRVDASKGYIPGNVVACCRSANQVKSFWEGRIPLIDAAAVRAIIEKAEAKTSPSIGQILARMRREREAT